MNQISLCYGRKDVDFPLPPAARVLSSTDIASQVSTAKFRTDLELFLTPLSPQATVAVVVADKTRLCGYDRFLPVLLEAIMKHGVAEERITIYIAYGTHMPQSEEESADAYGQAWSRFKFVAHDCRDRSLFRELGTTSRGTPVRLRKDICAADFLVTFGAISQHYFAGYGGGRKLIFPGLGEQAAIYHNHSLFLDQDRRQLSAGCAPGRISGNPLAEDLAEVERFRPADLAIHGILNRHGELCRIILGKDITAFADACRLHATHTEIKDPRTYDLVLASCGGFPKDINFIQSHKSVHNAAMFVKDGGMLVLLAQCPDGIGSTTFLPWFQMGGWAPAFDRLAEDYQGNGGTALAMMAKTRRITIGLITELDEAACKAMGVGKISLETAATMLKAHSGSLAIIPNAALLVKTAGPQI